MYKQNMINKYTVKIHNNSLKVMLVITPSTVNKIPMTIGLNNIINSKSPIPITSFIR